MGEEETKNTLLQELRNGLGNSTQNSSAQPQQTNTSNTDKSKEEMIKILAELKQKMAEIDKITEDLAKKREEMEEHTPRKTEKLLLEIKVPPLEMLK
ncbi:MAG: hypothetical protein WCW44_05840 [archaeon]|jgi:hypothetical protein